MSECSGSCICWVKLGLNRSFQFYCKSSYFCLYHCLVWSTPDGWSATSRSFVSIGSHSFCRCCNWQLTIISFGAFFMCLSKHNFRENFKRSQEDSLTENKLTDSNSCVSNDDEIKQNIGLQYTLKQIKVGRLVNVINIWMEGGDGLVWWLNK